MRDKTTWVAYNPGSEPSLFSGRGFTGHEHLPWFKLINMNGRIYNPLVGQFLSPDNHMQDPYYTQSLNRYTYCLNNPLKYTDPSGFTIESIMWQSYYGHLYSWIGGGNHHIQSAGYRSSRVMTQNDFDNLNNSELGGIWDEYSGLTYFSSYAEGVFYGCIYNEYHNSWGSTHAGSFIGAWSSFGNTGGAALGGVGAAFIPPSLGIPAGLIGAAILISQASFSHMFEGVKVYTSTVGALKHGAAFTLPGIGIFVNPNDANNTDLLKHEFGHVLQASKWGYGFFYSKVVPASLEFANYANGDPNYTLLDYMSNWTEWSANYLSTKYFNGNFNSTYYPTSPVNTGPNICNFPSFIKTPADFYNDWLK